MIDLVLVGKKIADLRCEHHLSQDQLADVLLVSRQAISAWETGKSAPSIDNIIELAKAFNVSFEEVLCLKDKSEIDPEDPYQGHEQERRQSPSIPERLSRPESHQDLSGLSRN